MLLGVTGLYIDEIRAGDREAGRLLIENGLRAEKNIDFLLGLYEDGELLATAGAFRDSLRLIAVKKERQGEGLLSRLIGEVISREFSRGYSKLFCYTKAENSVKLREFGFFELVSFAGFVFMENDRNGLQSYVKRLKQEGEEQEKGLNITNEQGPISAIVMKADPFSLGHLFLCDLACEKSRVVHLFIVREDRAFFSFQERQALINEGLKNKKNIIFHDTSSYLISSGVFPQYFVQDDGEAAKIQSGLDSKLFIKIAKELSITKRFVGDEELSPTTEIYNRTLLETLPKEGIELEIIKRKRLGSDIISASLIRKLIAEKSFDKIRELVPESSFNHIVQKYK